MTIGQVRKLLDKSRIKYSAISDSRLVLRDDSGESKQLFIESDSDYLTVFTAGSFHKVKFAFIFDKLEIYNDELNFSYKNQQPLIIF